MADAAQQLEVECLFLGGRRIVKSGARMEFFGLLTGSAAELEYVQVFPSLDLEARRQSPSLARQLKVRSRYFGKARSSRISS